MKDIINIIIRAAIILDIVIVLGLLQQRQFKKACIAAIPLILLAIALLGLLGMMAFDGL